MRSKILKMALMGLVLTVVLVAVAGASDGPNKGSFWYVVDNITEVAEGAEALVWVTLPPTWHGQEVTVSNITPEPVAIIDDATTGNRIIEWRLQPEVLVSTPVSEPTQLFFHYDFEVRELAVTKQGITAVTESYDRNSADYKRYTMQEQGIQTKGLILDLAREIAGDEKDPAVLGRLYYNWIMESLTFRPNGIKEWDAASINKIREGNCDQFSTLFVALCRSVGIPARTVANTWTWGGLHFFAEIMLPGHGWVPADPTLGQLMTAGRGGLSEDEVAATLLERAVPEGNSDWTYGNMFGNRLIISLGKNIKFASPTLGHDITLQRMAPGGIDAHPEGYRLTGFNSEIVHGGFYVFDEEMTEEAVHILAHQRLAKYFFKADVEDFVEDICRQATSKYANGADNWINLGKSYLHKKEYYKAEAAFQRALRLAIKHSRQNQGTIAWLHNYLGNCYDLLDQREMAVAQYTIVLKMENNFQGATKYATRYSTKPFTQN